MTPDEINHLRQLEREATPGRWYFTFDVGIRAEPNAKDIVVNDGGYYPPEDHDAHLIVALRNNATALLDKAERAEKLEAALREWVRNYPDATQDGGLRPARILVESRALLDEVKP